MEDVPSQRTFRLWPWLVGAALVPPSFLGASWLLGKLWAHPEYSSIGLHNVVCFMPLFAIVPFMAALVIIGFLQPIWRDDRLQRWTRDWFLRRGLPLFVLICASLVSALLSVCFFAIMI